MSDKMKTRLLILIPLVTIAVTSIAFPLQSFAEVYPEYNVGEVQWLDTPYNTFDKATVRVTDHDMNHDPEQYDTFDISVWSDSDIKGIIETVTETGPATGIFENTIYLTPNDDGCCVRLQVKEGDFIAAQYADHTLPESYAVDMLNIIAKSEIRASLESPLKQIKNGVALVDVRCDEEKSLVYKYDRMMAACVDDETEVELISRGWALLRLGFPDYSRSDYSSSLCGNYGGKWHPEYEGCRGDITPLQCSLMGGEFVDDLKICYEGVCPADKTYTLCVTNLGLVYSEGNSDGIEIRQISKSEILSTGVGFDLPEDEFTHEDLKNLEQKERELNKIADDPETIEEERRQIHLEIQKIQTRLQHPFQTGVPYHLILLIQEKYDIFEDHRSELKGVFVTSSSPNNISHVHHALRIGIHPDSFTLSELESQDKKIRQYLGNEMNILYEPTLIVPIGK